MNRDWWSLVLLMASAIGAAVASFALWAGLQDNNQGEFYDTVTGRPVWDSIALLWLSSFVSVFLMVAVPLALVYGLLAMTRNR